SRAPEFVADGQALAERALGAGQPAIAGEALRLVSVEHRATGHPAEARDAGQAALRALEPGSDGVALARGLHTLGLAWRELGHHDRALDAYARAYELAVQGDRLAARRVLADRADLLQLLGRWDESNDDIERSEALASRNESARNRSASTIASLQLVLAQGRLEKARTMAVKLVSDLRYLGIDSRLASVLLLAGEVYRFSDRFEEAGDHYRQALLMFDALGSPLAILARANLGMVRYASGEVEEAFDELSALLEEAEQGKVAWMLEPIRIARAPAAAGVGRWDLVRPTLDQLERGVETGGRVDLDAWWVSRELAALARSGGDGDRIARLERLTARIEERLPQVQVS
ncbi:MAG: hypothetical protein KDA24_24205, partial [Deltaproteobacteria bacterium]|nr:hypothetical protein [Deltaproteobacteria bacterium]